MAEIPLWRQNMWASRPALISRLEAIDGIDSVEALRDFKQVSDSETRTSVPEDGTMYVIKDGWMPLGSNNDNSEVTHEIGYTLAFAKFDPNGDGQEESLEKLTTRILVKIQGFEPKTLEGRRLSLTPFAPRQPLPISHDDGFSWYFWRFVTQVLVIAEHED